MKKALGIATVFALLVTFCLPAFAAKPMVVSARTLEGSEGPLVIDLGKTRLVKFELNGLDASRVSLRVRGKEMTLKSWLDQGKSKGLKLGRKNEITLSANASNFPNLTREHLDAIGRLKDFETFSPSTQGVSGTLYTCAIFIYGCFDIP
ncbi:MAG: hypothetical protein KDD47_10370 [Acidobacteria bacterium]|nr:hypothetical protein [Acidobacteriota bacterium]